MALGALHLPTSPYYWAVVGALSLAFALVDLEAFRRREVTRWHWIAIAIYVGACATGALAFPKPQIAWAVPVAIRIAFATIFFGGNVLAEAVRGEQWVVHPERREPEVPRPTISDAQLRAAEEYDARWHAEERERQHEQHRRSGH